MKVPVARKPAPDDDPRTQRTAEAMAAEWRRERIIEQEIEFLDEKHECRFITCGASRYYRYSSCKLCGRMRRATRQ